MTVVAAVYMTITFTLKLQIGFVSKSITTYEMFNGVLRAQASESLNELIIHSEEVCHDLLQGQALLHIHIEWISVQHQPINGTASVHLGDIITASSGVSILLCFSYVVRITFDSTSLETKRS